MKKTWNPAQQITLNTSTLSSGVNKTFFSVPSFFLLCMLLSGTWGSSLETGLEWIRANQKVPIKTQNLSGTSRVLETVYDSWISSKNKTCFTGLSGLYALLNPLMQRWPLTSPKLFVEDHIHHLPILVVSLLFFPLLTYLRNFAWALIKGAWASPLPSPTKSFQDPDVDQPSV